MKLSRLERLSLVNQLKVLEKLSPDDASYFSRQIEVLENGYEFLYSEIFQEILDGDDVMSEAECIEVWDTMSMFEGIDRSLVALNRAHDNTTFSKFAGYDGNSEGKFMGFAAFTVRREKRFTYLPLQREDYFNSHTPVREIYGRMKREWKLLDSAVRYSMSSEILDRLLETAIHPDNRSETS